MSSSSSSSAAAPTPFQSAGSYGLFNRAPVPAYNQFSASPLVSPQFGPVGVGEYTLGRDVLVLVQGSRVSLWLLEHVSHATEPEEVQPAAPPPHAP